MSQERPGQHELYSKVEMALEALISGRYMIAVPEHIADDLEDIEIDSQAAFWDLLPSLLDELRCAGPQACYVGWRPVPELAGELGVKGCKLWAFAWDSKELGFPVYLKFCLKSNSVGKVNYLHVRIHKDRPPKMKL